MSSEAAPLVVADDVAVHFPARASGLRRGRHVIRAVDGVSLAIRRGETFGLVGESGSGKSTLGRALIGLRAPTGGRVAFDGTVLGDLDARALRAQRRRFQIIFQDPFGSLNPRLRVEDLVGEPIDLHRRVSRADRAAEVTALLARVGLPPSAARRYPHEFSGGQRQRIGIARALAGGPEFVVCDEAVSALDVSIQAQILNLLMELREGLGLTLLFISHDLAVVRHVSHRVAVMYLGRVVEVGTASDVYRLPIHPYSRALLSGSRVADPKVERTRARIVLRGDVPSPSAPPPGCRFHPRCWLYERLGGPEACRRDDPVLVETAGRTVACHFADEARASDTGLLTAQVY